MRQAALGIEHVRLMRNGGQRAGGVQHVDQQEHEHDRGDGGGGRAGEMHLQERRRDGAAAG